MNLQEAISTLCDALTSDPEYRECWKANIAMAYKDCEYWYKQRTGKKVLNRADQHIIANEAADHFLFMLCLRDTISAYENPNPKRPNPDPGPHKAQDAMRFAESFLLGFEDDEIQGPIVSESLGKIRRMLEIIEQPAGSQYYDIYAQIVLDGLRSAESFLGGFEDDDEQGDSVKPHLAEIRSRISMMEKLKL
jgi:hypothetical protein